MRKIAFILLVALLPGSILAQTATLKIDNIHIEVDGEKVDFDKAYEIQLTDRVLSSVIIYEQDGLKYGHEFTYKKGTNRLKLLRRGYAIKAGMDRKYAKREKDMQEIKVSIPGSIKKRVVDNIVVDKETLEAINVSFNYELIYK